MRSHLKTMRGLAAVVTVAVVAVALSAGSALALAPTGGGGGGTGGGGSGSGGTPPPDNTVAFSSNSYLGDGHGQTASGFLDRTTNQLNVTTQTTSGWCYFGWHGASQVILTNSAGEVIWASGELGPTGVDGPACPFQSAANVVNVSYPAISIPAAVVRQAVSIDVFNFWDPQWTGVTKVM